MSLGDRSSWHLNCFRQTFAEEHNSHDYCDVVEYNVLSSVLVNVASTCVYNNIMWMWAINLSGTDDTLLCSHEGHSVPIASFPPSSL
jgi:hypothetical protein